MNVAFDLSEEMFSEQHRESSFVEIPWELILMGNVWESGNCNNEICVNLS